MILISRLYAGGFQTVAIAGFVSPVAVALFGPLVGQALDRKSRQAGLTLAVACQAVCITMAGAELIIAIYSHSHAASA